MVAMLHDFLAGVVRGGASLLVRCLACLRDMREGDGTMKDGTADFGSVCSARSAPLTPPQKPEKKKTLSAKLLFW